jgi:hypothetical protein
MENIENFKQEEVIELTPKQQLVEQYDTLAVEHTAALEANDENKAKEIEARMNEISEKLGWDEEIKTAA